MKPIAAFFSYVIVCLFAVMTSCSKPSSKFENKSLLVGKKWLTVEGSKNGVLDPTIPGQQIVLEFRNDGKMYFQQVFPPVIDTVAYKFLSNLNIKITKPWVSYPININYQIDFIDASHFDFTLTSVQHSDVYIYKTIAQ